MFSFSFIFTYLFIVFTFTVFWHYKIYKHCKNATIVKNSLCKQINFVNTYTPAINYRFFVNHLHIEFCDVFLVFCVGEVWLSVYLLCILTFSLWMSFLICEILIFMASISSSWTRGMGLDSQSSMVWKVRSASGMYHLQSYCCPFLSEDKVCV